MVIDGVPRGVSLIEKYCWEYLNLQNDLKSRIATRVTQLFGRIIRGRVDHGCFYIFSRDLNIWLRDQRNLALLPELLANQIQLGEYIHEALSIKTPDDASKLVSQVLSREEGWIKFYRDWLNEQSVSEDAKRASEEQQAAIREIALAWVRLWSAMWKGDDADKIVRLRGTIEQHLPALATADSRGAGWVDMWLGVSYKIDGEHRSAQDHFARARGRLLAALPLPRAQLEIEGADQIEASPMGRQFLDIFGSGVIEANRRIARDDTALDALTGSPSSPREYEEALRFFGQRLGFQSTRPDNEVGSGPDNLWMSDDGSVAIGLEAKTEKQSGEYNKADIGQAHNHVQWMADRLPHARPLGVAIIGTPESCTAEASPSEAIFMVHSETIARLVASYKDLRQVVAGQFGSARVAQVATLGLGDEWAIESIWQRLDPKSF
ncbi:MAG: hypothetical protein Q7J13_13240 [Brevundimonas sp.]|nr:hypothetical protein [Brevundimonas sp.]MDO9588884.1 hypothetical protein [Brevundimonas sp.]